MGHLGRQAGRGCPGAHHVQHGAKYQAEQGQARARAGCTDRPGGQQGGVRGVAKG